KTPWIINKIKEHSYLRPTAKVLDVGCGAGFLSNELAKEGLQVTGVDLSVESLKIAQAHDSTSSVHYQTADAYKLPFADQSFDVLTAMDLLEHIEKPDEAIIEFARVLKPNGLFIFHTMNRNPISYIVIIKFVEWFVKNTPPNMHVINLFIKPHELKQYCQQAQMQTKEMVGIRPNFSTVPIKSFFTGVVPESMSFELTKSLMLSYMGIALKNF
ncbi:MAG: bifunctional 2-polyprenyl-6-hydroxyphenol methylase/3-demethylubiquinol 3-O-methyltransferase UbiG, partial [Bacteriovorax sp.]